MIAEKSRAIFKRVEQRHRETHRRRARRRRSSCGAFANQSREHLSHPMLVQQATKGLAVDAGLTGCLRDITALAL
jgi:hypothetical protein